MRKKRLPRAGKQENIYQRAGESTGLSCLITRQVSDHLLGEPSPEAEKLPSLSPGGQAAVDLPVSTPHWGSFLTSSKFTNIVNPRCVVLLDTKSSLTAKQSQTDLPNRRCFIPLDLAKQTDRSFACLHLPKDNCDNGDVNVHSCHKGHFGKRRILNTILNTNLLPLVAANDSQKG